jgi:hypothetical protein
MSALQRARLTGYLRHCEANPKAWESGELRIPLWRIGMTFEQADALFGLPGLPEVRQAVEDWITDDEAGHRPWGSEPEPPLLGDRLAATVGEMVSRG